VPRQITTFEFKLIGELTIKQFGYLAVCIIVAVLFFFLVPKILYLNYIVAIFFALLGVGFAFVPINERPMDVWLRNFSKRLFSATQYYYRKNNPPPKILLGLQLPPREVLLQHVKAQQSLNEYLQKKPKTTASDNVEQIDKSWQKKQADLSALISTAGPPPAAAVKAAPLAYTPISFNSGQVGQEPVLETTPEKAITEAPPEQSNLAGVVLSASGVPLPNQLVYLKKGVETVRLFKTNTQGRFQNSLPLTAGEYLLEIADPQKKHIFARMKVGSNSNNLRILAQK